MKSYTIGRTPTMPPLLADWSHPCWSDIPALEIDQFHARSTHRPITHAKLLVSDDALHVIFRVQDRYVRSVATQYQDMVCRDSCVELFLEPKPGKGYFNFEMNGGGALLLFFIQDHRRVGPVFEKYEPVSPELGQRVRIRSTLPPTVPVEITEPIEWRLQAMIPLAVMEAYVGPISLEGRQTWRGNLYKCGSVISHPHWASWSCIGEELNFHLPEKFGNLIVAPAPE